MVAERLLQRLARRGDPGAVVRSEGCPVASRVYQVLSAFEETGRCRRGYFVAGPGAAQFGTAGAVDRLRTFSEVPPDAKRLPRGRAGGDRTRPTLRRGARLRRRSRAAQTTGTGHRPGRKAGAIVVPSTAC